MADLLPGSSAEVIAENVRALRAQGYSESEAVKRAHAYAKGAGNDDADDAPADVRAVDTRDDDLGGDADEGTPDRQFVVVTKDMSGLGWAKKLQEEGETVTLACVCPEEKPEDKARYDQVARNWIPRMTLEEAMGTLQTPQTYWIFAENNFPEEADKLRAAGQKVFGTSALSEKMEHDRQYGVDVAEQCGLPSPPTHQFSSREEGLAFLDANPDKSYVFKPDDGKYNYLTFVPRREQDEDANREVHTYLSHMAKDPGSYILQERVRGIELNAEVWVYEGKPFFSFVTLESKRKNDGDLGEMSGCAGDFVWVTPLDSPLVQDTIGRLLPFYEEQKYTGFADVNVILTESGPLFLEVCNRFGYNSHVSLFLGLALDGFGQIMADFMDGQTEGMYDRFRQNFLASSITVFLDHPREGLPVHIDDRYHEQFYPFDGYMEDGTFLLAGYSSEVGILVDCSAHTVQEAAQHALDKLQHQEAVSFPDMYYRTDLGDRDYPNAPNSRWHGLAQMTNGLGA